MCRRLRRRRRLHPCIAGLLYHHHDHYCIVCRLQSALVDTSGPKVALHNRPIDGLSLTSQVARTRTAPTRAPDSDYSSRPRSTPSDLDLRDDAPARSGILRERAVAVKLRSGKLASSSATSTPSPVGTPVPTITPLPKPANGKTPTRLRSGRINGGASPSKAGGGRTGTVADGGAGPAEGGARSHASSTASSGSGARSNLNLVGYLASGSSGAESASDGDGGDDESTASEGDDRPPHGGAFLKQPRARTNRVWRGLTSLTSPSHTPQGSTPLEELDHSVLSDQPSAQGSARSRRMLVERRERRPQSPQDSTASSLKDPPSDGTTSLFPSLAAAVSAAKASASAAYALRAERDRGRKDDEVGGVAAEIARSRGRMSPHGHGRTRDKVEPARDSIDAALSLESPDTNAIPERPGSPGSYLHPPRRKGPVTFRSASLLEVSLVVGALFLTLIRLMQLPLVDPSTSPARIPRPLPIPQLLVLAVAIPFVALLRRQGGCYLVPFTDERGYRAVNMEDDGIVSALGLPLLLAGAVAFDAGSAVLAQSRSDGEDVFGAPGIRSLEELWASRGLNPTTAATFGRGLTGLAGRLVFASPQKPAIEPASAANDVLLQARVLYSARVDLLCFCVLCAFVLLLDIWLARMALRLSWGLPRSNTKRFFGSMAKSAIVSLVVYLVVDQNLAGPGMDHGHLSAFESAVAVFLSQSSTYIITRLARRGFTLGEVSLFGAAGMSLLLEIGRLTITRWYYPALDASTLQSAASMPALFRRATPITAFQHALIPGIFTIGFGLAPLLLASRALAQQPTRRRRPGAVGVLDDKREKERLRWGLAFSVYAGALAIIFGVIAGWIGWVLAGGWAEPWLWAIRFTVFGGDGVDGMTRDTAKPRRWVRVGLILYWLACLSSAVGGWTTHIVRKRRLRVPPPEAEGNGSSGPASPHQGPVPPSAKPSAIRDGRRLRAELNWRRKFFHGLALLMFVPGIAIDVRVCSPVVGLPPDRLLTQPAFTSLSFSVAFSLLTFAEYARYFAVLPIGAPIHIFFVRPRRLCLTSRPRLTLPTEQSEFVDDKDSGPVILSHFYLLTGCAGGLWLEGGGVKQMAGVLTLGVGDAVASIVGKRFGRIRWPGSSKVSSVPRLGWLIGADSWILQTIEGTIAFVVSLSIAAFLLRLIGAVPRFSVRPTRHAQLSKRAQ